MGKPAPTRLPGGVAGAVPRGTVYLVQLSLGPAMDWPAGAIYRQVTYLVRADRSEVVLLPTNVGGNYQIVGRAFSQVSRNRDLFGHFPLLEPTSYFDDFAADSSVVLSRRSGHYGWEITSPRFLAGYNIFVYMKDSSETWDFTGLPRKSASNEPAAPP